MKDLTYITAHDTLLQVRNVQLVKGLGLITAEIKRQNDENIHTDVNEYGKDTTRSLQKLLSFRYKKTNQMANRTLNFEAGNGNR